MGKRVLGPVRAAGAGAAVQGFYCGLDLASPLRQDVSTHTWLQLAEGPAGLQLSPCINWGWEHL